MESMLNLPLLRRRISELYGTQAAFAQRCGWSRQYVSRVLSGSSSISLQRAGDMADALGIPISTVLRPSHTDEIIIEYNYSADESLDDVLREVVGKYAHVRTSSEEFTARKELEKALE